MKKPIRFSPTDTAVCLDYKCPSRNHCLRFSVDKAEKWQVYANFERKPEQQQCSHYLGEITP